MAEEHILPSSEIPPSYYKYMGTVKPPLKMGKPATPITWRVGFNGPPGGGKSVSCAWFTAAQFLLRGIPVWTLPETYYIKVNIRWEGKIYAFESHPLDLQRLIMFDPELAFTCIVVDEANLQLADSHRSMSNKNLYTADYVQQARHAHVSLLYTCILPNWIDPRLRQLTDVLVYCTDAAQTAWGDENHVDEGEWCNWSLTDQSGQLTGRPFEIDPEYYSWGIHLKDYWHITDSFNTANSLEARKNIEMADNSKIIIGEDPRAEEARMIGVTLEGVLQKLAENAYPDNNGRVLIPVPDVWREAGAVDRLLAQKILNGLGIRQRSKNLRSYYDITDFVEIREN